MYSAELRTRAPGFEQEGKAPKRGRREHHINERGKSQGGLVSAAPRCAVKGRGAYLNSERERRTGPLSPVAWLAYQGQTPTGALVRMAACEIRSNHHHYLRSSRMHIFFIFLLGLLSHDTNPNNQVGPSALAPFSPPCVIPTVSGGVKPSTQTTPRVRALLRQVNRAPRGTLTTHLPPPTKSPTCVPSHTKESPHNPAWLQDESLPPPFPPHHTAW